MRKAVALVRSVWYLLRFGGLDLKPLQSVRARKGEEVKRINTHTQARTRGRESMHLFPSTSRRGAVLIH